MSSVAQIISFSKCLRSNNSLAHKLTRIVVSHEDLVVFLGALFSFVSGEKAFWKGDLFSCWFTSVLTEEFGVIDFNDLIWL